MEINKLDRSFKTLCLYAVIELDNLRLRKKETFNCVKGVEEWLTQNLFDPEQSNPTAITAVKNAMIACDRLRKDETATGELLKKVVVIRDSLLAVATHPIDFYRYKGKELNELKKFCIELTKNAATYEL